MFLETERLVLRAFAPGDVAGYAALNGDPEVMRYLGGPRSGAESEEEIAHNNRTLADRGFGKVAVARKADGAFLGMCGLSHELWYPNELEIGWRLARAHWGQGYATEAARAWLGHAFGVLGATRAISISDVPNLRSFAVMRRIGMHHDHTATLSVDGDSFEAEVWAIGAEAFRAASRDAHLVSPGPASG